MPLISFIDINAQIFANNTYPAEASPKDNVLVPSIGKSWKYPIIAERLQKKIFSKINDLNAKKANCQAKLNDLSSRLTERQKNKIEDGIAEIDNCIQELTQSIADIERVGHDKAHIYDFNNLTTKGLSFGVHYIVKGTDNVITIQGTTHAQFIHEIRHLSLSLQSKNGLRFSKNNFLMPVFANGIEDELQAYRAQYAFEASSLPGFYPKSYAQVNLTYLNSILLDDGSFAYSTQRNISVDETKMAKNTLKMDENKISQVNLVIDTYRLNKNLQILKQKVRE